ncbi:unnamed protein product, partial [Mesorhabditis belari]|uniref:Uncharacterized protein n=1 Tax=Mesorhabditis belari TaxID=2138241 RepID=A0AAF3F6Z1_9BILA
MLHYDEESGLSIGDLLFLSPEESTFSYKFLADELYDAVKGNKSYWMTKGDAGELPIITDFEKRFSELLHVVWGDQIEPEVAPTQPLTVESTEERSLQEDVIAARTLADMGEIEIPEEVEEKNLELQKWNKYHKILRALLRNAQDKEFYRNALMLLKENSGVSNEDLDFVFTFLR